MITPIPGNDLRVGDVLLGNTQRRMTVERITLVTRPGYPTEPMFEAHGRTEWADGHTTTLWTDRYFGAGWVVVDR
jgi:hypothetical protein